MDPGAWTRLRGVYHHGIFMLGEGELPAGFLGKSKLWVDVKGDIQKGEHIVQIRQIYRGVRVVP